MRPATPCALCGCPTRVVPGDGSPRRHVDGGSQVEHAGQPIGFRPEES